MVVLTHHIAWPSTQQMPPHAQQMGDWVRQNALPLARCLKPALRDRGAHLRPAGVLIQGCHETTSTAVVVS